MQSGGYVPTVFFGLIDAYGQVVSTDRGSRINFELTVDEETFHEEQHEKQSKEPEFETEIVGVTEFFSAFGTYNMSGMTLLSQPGVDIPVKLVINAIDVAVPSVAAYL